MCQRIRLLHGVAILTLGLVWSGPAAAQMAQTHIRHVADSFNGTPENKGFYATALGEAQVVVTHAGLMANATTNLNQMKTHAGHIINAIDPTQVATGPGLGYGLKKAAENSAAHIELAAKAEGASANVTTHSVHIATSSRNTIARADQIVALAKQIQAATTPEQAAPLAQQIKTLADQLLPGLAGTNGRVGWQEGQGGLDIVGTHIGLLKTAEGMTTAQ
jgi:hypothetical protein